MLFLTELQNQKDYLNLPALKTKSGATNHANMHPRDLETLGILDDSEILVKSKHGEIPAVVRSNDRIKQGVIAMHHCWGPPPGQQAPVRETGSNLNALVNGGEDLQPYTAMARMSGIPVNIRQV